METTQHQTTDDDERLFGDLLVGARAIADYCISLGMIETDEDGIYYLKRAGWPIGNTGNGGGKLIASKRRLARHAQRLTSPTTN